MQKKNVMTKWKKTGGLLLATRERREMGDDEDRYGERQSNESQMRHEPNVSPGCRTCSFSTV